MVFSFAAKTESSETRDSAHLTCKKKKGTDVDDQMLKHLQERSHRISQLLRYHCPLQALIRMKEIIAFFKRPQKECPIKQVIISLFIYPQKKEINSHHTIPQKKKNLKIY